MSLGKYFQRALRRQGDALRALNAWEPRFMSSLSEEEEDAVPFRTSTPWVRSVISGVDLMRSAKVRHATHEFILRIDLDSYLHKNKISIFTRIAFAARSPIPFLI